MRRVALYPILEREGYFYLNLPRGAQPLSLHEGESGLEMALIVNGNASLENKKFLLVEKDQVIENSPPNKLIFVGMFNQEKKTSFVFEVK